MDVTITVDQLDTADLGTFNEIWLGGAHHPMCLWRGEQVFSHEMMSEGTHDQNVRRLYVQLLDPEEQTAVVGVESILRERLAILGRAGEFYPAEEVDTHHTD